MRFGRLVVLLVLVAGVVFADDSDESKATEKIELLGGKITRDESSPGCPVVEVDLGGSKRFNDKYVHLLKSFPRMSLLKLRGCSQITDASVVELRDLKNLVGLDVRGTQVTHRGVNLIWESLPKLQACEESRALSKLNALGGQFYRDLELSTCPITKVVASRTNVSDEDLKDLIDLKSVTALTLDNTAISDDGLKIIVGFENLTRLSLWQTKITDSGLRELAGLKRLTSLNLLECSLSDVGMKELKVLKGLTELSISGQHLTDLSLKELSELENLNKLVFVNAQLTDAGLTELSKFKQLTELNINRTKITNGGLKEIGKLKLNTLNIGATQITDDGLKELIGSTNLRLLFLRDTQVSDEGISELKKTNRSLAILN